MTEAEIALVRKAQAGDRRAFEEMVRRVSRMLYARLYLETGDSDRTEDLVQETLISAYRALHRLQEPASFRAWILRIAQNTLTDASRHDHRHKRAAPPRAAPEALAALPSDDPPPSWIVEREETHRQVLEVLRSLPDEYRLPLTLRYLVGADYASICQQLGLSNGSLRGVLHRGLKLLRALLPAEGLDPVQSSH